MVQIVNRIKTNIYDILLKRQEANLSYKKEYLVIKTEEVNEKRAKNIAKTELLFNHKLAKYETHAGIASSYINELIREKEEIINKQAKLDTRVLKQKIKRAKSDDLVANLNKKIADVEVNRLKRISDAKVKYLNPNPSESDKALYDNQRKELEDLKQERIKKINLKADLHIEKINKQTQASIEKLSASISSFKEKLIKLEEQMTDKNTVVLEKDLILSLRNLSMHFGGLKAVDDLSFDVKKGEIFGLIGPNGAGKTTVFNCITRFYKPTSGNIYFNNVNGKTVHLNEMKVHNVIKEGIVRTFQNVELVWELNILDNLLVAAHSSYRSSFFHHLVHSRLTKREEVIYTKKAMKILNDLDLTPYTYAFPIGLPYGVLKKVELARTLMSNPKLIILDEPAAGLNDTETKELSEFIKKIKDEYDVTIFLVEHDMGLVMSICDTVCAISFGKKLDIGTPKQIQSSKVVQEAYLGGE